MELCKRLRFHAYEFILMFELPKRSSSIMLEVVLIGQNREAKMTVRTETLVDSLSTIAGGYKLLAESFKRALLAENKSERTIEV